MVQGKPNIFHFMDFREYLKAYFEYCKFSEPGFSMRTFLGKISHSSFPASVP
jgi:hypothetical protein